MDNIRKNQLQYLYGITNAKSGIDLKKKRPFETDNLLDIENGKIDDSIYNTIYEQNAKQHELEKGKEIPIIILTKIIESTRIVDEFDVDGILIDDKDVRETAILYIPAMLYKNGELKPGKDNSLPWIPTGLLAPFGEYLSIGEWKEPSTGIDTEKMSWHEYWSLAMKIYENSTGRNWNEPYIDDTERTKRRYDFKSYACIIYDDTVLSTKHIRKLYQSLIEFCEKEKSSFPLLDKMLSSPIKVKDTPYNPFGEERIDCMKKHLGVMSGLWTLSPSQRESIHHLKEVDEGSVLAVAGPPGTGKTTLLQSVVADLIVEHAINEKVPPVIVATSTNNKAVINVIDSFSNVSKDNTDKLGLRWTCAQSLAAFFPSSTQYNKEEYRKYFKTTNRGKDCYAALEDKKEEMADEYKGHFEEYFGKINVGGNTYWEKVKQRILQEINTRKKLMCDILDAISKVDEAKKEKEKKNFLRSLLSMIGLKQLVEKVIDNKIEQAYVQLERIFGEIEKPKPLNDANDEGTEENISYYKERLKHITKYIHETYNVPKTDDIRKVTSSELNGIIDITLRYQMFWLAVHYYEARWLSGESILSKDDLSKNTKAIQDRRFHRMAMLQPCMVMTFFMLPNVFELYERDKKKFPYYQDIDLLIVDEAGQVSPEMAIPSFALAKRSIIVGDSRQIPPVWSVSKKVDFEMARKYKVTISEKDFDESLLNCSSSSLMKVSCSVCEFQKYPKDKSGKGERGLFLSEHRRCYKEIIDFCNDLIYEGRLNPVRPDVFDLDKAKKLGKDCPAMGHLHVEHQKSEPKEGSRQCVQEAEAIAQWLANNYPAIKTAYTKNGKFNVKETLSVITPFKTQTIQVGRALKKYPELSEIPFGTVHTFQGAESKIVFFSTVYGKDEGWNFIKNNDNLINVAVSRAKDYFFTFGERSIAGGGDSSKNAAQLLLDYTDSKIPISLTQQIPQQNG